ncbi:hypothetical protein SCACP_23410 [Sporomusa carbonis]|uniref:hypothetical protein n=1 Tax=Sporomusa carbonis TaxID=3076075 RepID=UPI003A5E7DA7
METKYPHWYGPEDKMSCCVDYPDKDMMCCDDNFIDDHMAYKMYGDNFKDRLMCFLGDEVVLGTDAIISHKCSTFCGTICYVGCDYIIVNSTYCRRAISLHVPIKMIRFIAPFKHR